MTHTLADLGALTAARQFPAGVASVAEAVARIGPIQAQTARSPYVAVAARFPGLTRAAVTAAYESGQIVRGSTIRGTVHTTTPAGFTALGVATAIGQRRLFERGLGLRRARVDDLWRAVEEYAATWRSVEDLVAFVRSWLGVHEGAESADRVVDTVGRYLAFGHGGLVRRPTNGDWGGQGAAQYRTLPPVGSPTLADVVRLHLAAHGPATRQDLAWWSGCGLRVVDAALDALGLVGVPGPGGRRYVDLTPRPAGVAVEGVRLLPEFDALMCAYDRAGRGRFADAEVLRVLWDSRNGLVRPPLLVDGRITGHWRSSGSGRRRSVEVTWFAGTRRPRPSELDAAVGATAAALGVEVAGVTLARASP